MENISYTFSEFLGLSKKEFKENLSNHHSYNHNELGSLQQGAWEKEYDNLSEILKGKTGRVLFEYSISSHSKATDVILLLNGKIFVLEYKTGEQSDSYNKKDILQTKRYALILKYCHSTSNDKWIIPVLIAVNASESKKMDDFNSEDKIYNTILTNAENLNRIIEQIDKELEYDGTNEWEKNWGEGIYKASPTIIEAARNVWRQNKVKGFTLGESDEVTRLSAENYIKDEVISETRKRPDGKKKSICFVAGVPGAGKTLVGLNLSVALEHYGASMLSGNGPLVTVLTEALKRDNRKLKKENITLKDEISIDSIIRDVYGYKAEIINKRLSYNSETHEAKFKEGADPGSQYIIIFDEAQRAWTQKKMITPGRKQKQPWQEEFFPFSEPKLLLWDMNNRDWGVFICLVGGGQEINNGETGLCEWLSALKDDTSLSDWHIYLSDELKAPEYNRKDKSGQTIKDYCQYFYEQNRITISNSLYLTASKRTPRSENVSAFINAILECDIDPALSFLEQIRNKYPIYITRDINRAKQYLRKRQHDLALINVKKEDLSELTSDDLDETRIGMLMSSNAKRLRPYGYPAGVYKEDSIYKSWYLDTSEFVNSSNCLEVALDEFGVQGLEIDLDIVMWDADFRYNTSMNAWEYFKFNGHNWSAVDATKTDYETQQFYMKNAYRVLLTRARRGMIIFIPEGSGKDERGHLLDATRDPKFYDSTYNYLHKIIGIKELQIQTIIQY